MIKPSRCQILRPEDCVMAGLYVMKLEFAAMTMLADVAKLGSHAKIPVK